MNGSPMHLVIGVFAASLLARMINISSLAHKTTSLLLSTFMTDGVLRELITLIILSLRRLGFLIRSHLSSARKVSIFRLRSCMNGRIEVDGHTLTLNRLTETTWPLQSQIKYLLLIILLVKRRQEQRNLQLA